MAAFNMPQRPASPAQVKPWIPQSSPAEEDTEPPSARTAVPVHTAGDLDATILAVAQRTDLPIFSVGDVDYALGAAAAIKQGGTVVAGLPMPSGMAATLSHFQKAVDDYWIAYRQRREVRNLYLLLLLMLTSLALFASSWLALHLSKQVTKPVEALADAMEAIAAGDYAHRVGESATEELGELVRSFNHMAADLEGSRQAAETSTAQLSLANAALEARRGELETMLETIPNGVATLDTNRRVVLANRALTEMLDPGGQTPFIGTAIETIFPAEAMEQLDHLLRRSHRMGAASGEMEMTVAGNGIHSGGTMHLLVTVALLETGVGAERTHHGYVLVLENATELLRAQKQSAWKEVARRVAHEIKNPLTPISLSAEQIHRHIDSPGHNPRRGAGRVAVGCGDPQIQRGHFFVGREYEVACRPVRRAGPVPHRAAASRRPEHHHRELARALRRPPAEHPPGQAARAWPSAGARRPGSNEARAGQPDRQRRRSHAAEPVARIARQHRPAAQRHGRAHRLRHRLRPDRRDAGAALPALLLHQAARHRAGPRHRRQDHPGARGTIRAEKNDPAGAKFIVELCPATDQRRERRHTRCHQRSLESGT